MKKDTSESKHSLVADELIQIISMLKQMDDEDRHKALGVITGITLARNGAPVRQDAS